MNQAGPGLKQYLDIAVRRWWILLIPPVVAAAAAYAYYRETPKLYRAFTNIEVLEQQVPKGLMSSTVTIDVEDRINLILPILQADKNLEYIGLETGVIADGADPADVRDDLRQAVHVEVDKSTGKFYTIEVIWPDVDQVADVTAAFSDRFKEEHRGLRLEQARRHVEFFQEIADEAEEALRVKRSEYLTFLTSNFRSLPESQNGVYQNMEANRRQIEGLNTEIKEHFRRISELELQRDRPNGSMPGLNEPVVDPDVLQLEEKRRELDAALATLAEAHPTVKRLRREIGRLEARVDEKQTIPGDGETEEPVDPRVAVLNAAIDDLRAQTEDKEAQKRRLEREIDDLRGYIDQNPSVAARALELEQEVARLQAAYDEATSDLSKTQQSLRLETSGESEAFRDLKQPVTPERPFSPDFLQIMLMGVMLGGLVGVGAVTALEVFDQSYKSEEQLLADFDLPVLAVVPNLDSVVARARKQQQRKVRRGPRKGRRQTANG